MCVVSDLGFGVCIEGQVSVRVCRYIGIFNQNSLSRVHGFKRLVIRSRLKIFI